MIECILRTTQSLKHLKMEQLMSNTNKQVIDTLMVKVGEFLTSLADKIDQNLDAGVHQGGTKLGGEFAEKFSLPEPLGISLASMYVNNHPDLASKKGPNGGIVRISEITEKSETKSRSRKVADIVIPGLDSDDSSDE